MPAGSTSTWISRADSETLFCGPRKHIQDLWALMHRKYIFLTWSVSYAAQGSSQNSHTTRCLNQSVVRMKPRLPSDEMQALLMSVQGSANHGSE
ncbi:hypothetical protein WJX82_001769 [Trebouxia sp. C0006]